VNALEALLPDSDCSSLPVHMQHYGACGPADGNVEDELVLLY
jgi:hypothetical protein